MTLYWPVVFAIVAIGAASIGFLDAGTPAAQVARLVSLAFLGLAVVLAVARRQWRHLDRQRQANHDPETRGPAIFR
jgi:uncharacterized membrane protein YtjA (UPF0391 family)